MIEKKWLEKLDKVHPYPAKFPVSTAEEYITKYSNVGDVVFDPFVGSGSSLLAATANNRFAVGTDINGIAVLISKFKLLNIDDNDIEILNAFLASVKRRMESKSYGLLWHYDSINHWFSNSAIEALSCIKNEIHHFFNDDCKLKIFCSLVLSTIINTVSKQESDTRYAAVEKEWVTRIRKIKDIDIMVTAITDRMEIPLVLIEYSTAVPTDDHIMQRSDVVYWSAKFKVPSLKISPLNKGMANEHGGGDKITDEFEKRVAIKNNAVYYTLKWQCNEETDVLLTNDNRLSCIPYSTTLRNYFLKMVDSFVVADSHFAYFDKLLADYKSENAALPKTLSMSEVKEMFPTSTRFTWTDRGLTAKINRFGHAMDPDRGVIYFCNMMNGTESTFAEFQLERSSVDGRGGYNSLFDMMANKEEMIKYVSEHKVSFSTEDARHVFFRGLGIDWYFKKISIEKGVVNLDDAELLNYLRNASGFALKSIFILSNNIVLTDKGRKLLLTIKYNRNVIDRYLEILNTFTYEITKIRQLESDDINEDIVTYASAYLLKAAGMKILAISYPGAQGDRCMLIGEGRNIDREYIDLIAYSEEKDDTINVTLHESKDKLSKSSMDIRKLNTIISSEEQIASLKKLTLKIINNDSISTISIGIGGKGSIMPTGVKLDYVMLFDLENNKDGVDVLWSIGVINTNLIDALKPLLNDSGKLSGRISVGSLYCIK